MPSQQGPEERSEQPLPLHCSASLRTVSFHNSVKFPPLSPCLQMRKLRPRWFKWLIQSQKTGQLWGQHSNLNCANCKDPVLPAALAVPFPTAPACQRTSTNSSLPFPEPLALALFLAQQVWERQECKMDAPLSPRRVSCPQPCRGSPPYLGLLLLRGVHDGGAAHLGQLTALAVE